MAEVQYLQFELMDEGGTRSDGKSFNTWGRVAFPFELAQIINEGKFSRKGKSCVFTAYDDVIYMLPGSVPADDLPKISATQKSCFEDYSAVCENMSSKIAMALDMPTSYNYIARFDPNQYPEIIENYPVQGNKPKPKSLCIVSVDFLKPSRTKATIDKTIWRKKNGEEQEIYSINGIDGDKLISFEDAIRKFNIGARKLDGEQNLIENWLKAVDYVVHKEVAGLPREYVNDRISKIHSRIARSFLLREFLGDCDFTAYNGGLVVNHATKSINYAPNFDYGDTFNPLRKNILLTPDPYFGMTQEAFEALPANAQEMLKQSYNKRVNLTTKEVARSFASGTSERNLNFVLENFPGACKEFFENLDQITRRGELEKIVDSYTEMTVDEEPILNDEEASKFKEFLEERAIWMSTQYVNYCQNNNQAIPGAEALIDFNELGL